MKKSKKILFKYFKKENEIDSLFKAVDKDSLKLFAEMMRVRYGS